MKLISSMALLCAVACAWAQNTSATKKLRLRYVRPTALVRLIDAPSGGQKLTPTGVTSMSASDADMTLVVSGSATGIKEMEEIARMLDVKPRTVRLEVRVVRHFKGEDGQTRKEVLTAPTVLTANNDLAIVSTKNDHEGVTLDLKPRINGDNTVTLYTKLTVADAGGSITHATNGTLRFRTGKSVLVLDEGYKGPDATGAALSVRTTVEVKATIQDRK